MTIIEDVISSYGLPTNMDIFTFDSNLPSYAHTHNNNNNNNNNCRAITQCMVLVVIRESLF